MMEKPVKPNIEDCCNSGCNPCIFDVYEKQLKLYKAYKQSGETYNAAANDISPLEYKSFIVLDIIDLDNKHKLLLFKLNSPNNKSSLVKWHPGDHFLYKYVSKEISCTRAYTPLKLNVQSNDYDFCIIIKRYEQGLVSNYLCDLNAGDLTLWRGPYGNYIYLKDNINRLIMVAQGTGIAPFYNIIQHIISDDENMTQIYLFYCCKNIDCILLRQELYEFQSYWNFKYEVYLSEIPTKPVSKYKEPLLFRKLIHQDILKLQPFISKDQFLLCGSTTFMGQYKQILIRENVDENAIITF